MGAGLEAFIYRELEALYAKGYSFTLFATKFKTGDIYAPKPDWPYHSMSLPHLVLIMPWLVLRMCLKPRLLYEATMDGGLVDLIFATKFASIMKRDINNMY